MFPTVGFKFGLTLALLFKRSLFFFRGEKGLKTLDLEFFSRRPLWSCRLNGGLLRFLGCFLGGLFGLGLILGQFFLHSIHLGR